MTEPVVQVADLAQGHVYHDKDPAYPREPPLGVREGRPDVIVGHPRLHLTRMAHNDEMALRSAG